MAFSRRGNVIEASVDDEDPRRGDDHNHNDDDDDDDYHDHDHDDHDDHDHDQDCSQRTSFTWRERRGGLLCFFLLGGREKSESSSPLTKSSPYK